MLKASPDATPTSPATATTPSVPTPKPKPTPPSQPVKPTTETPETLSNNAILEAQKKLSRMGYYQGVLDGVYNQLLRAALWAFQKDEDLPQTGRLDERTRLELNV